MKKTGNMKVYCNQHKEKVLEMFCVDCKLLTCSMCISKSHRKHELVDMNEVAGEFRKQMTDDVIRMFGSLLQCRELVERQKKSRTEFIEKVDKVEREICEQVEQRIDREKQTLIEELEEFKRDRVKLIDNMVEDTEQHAGFIESLVARERAGRR